MSTIEHSLDTLSSFLDKALERYWGDSEEEQGVPSWHVDRGEPGQSGDQVVSTIQDSVSADEEAWSEAEQAFEAGVVLAGIVTGWNRGGLLVRWNGLQAFVPISQLKKVPIFQSDESRDEALARWVGEELDLRVIEMDRARNRLVLSERATLWGPKDGTMLLQEISPGQVRKGYVSNLCDFGAFVDLGGVDGLVHISELSWGRVNHPREVLHIGGEVQVYVLEVDRESRRIALSLKRLTPNPWVTVEAKYYVGQVTRATITNVVDFGAFAQLEEGVEGLVHVSEMSGEKVSHPSALISEGDRVLVRILRIDSAHHRLGLSMRRALVPQDTAEQESY